MKGFNQAILVGTVLKAEFSTTKTKGDDVCNFTMIVDEGRDAEPLRVRVNVFGNSVEPCKKFLKNGLPVFVYGKMMNRVNKATGSMVNEIKCVDIKFLNHGASMVAQMSLDDNLGNV